jgi:hypothetical protein
MTITEVELTDTFNTWRQRTNLAIVQLNNLGDNSDVNITGGDINGTQIGNVTPSTGVFTNLTVNSTTNLASSTILLSDNQISGNKVSGGTIDNVIVELSSAPTINSHATRKDYVDGEISSLRDEMIQYALTFGE